MSPLLLGALAFTLAACGGPADDASSGRSDTLVVSSDRELAATAREILPDLVRRSGLELREPVRLERRSRAELVRYLRTKLDEELPPEEAARRVRSYALLGLVPDSLDLRGLLLSVYTEQVAGFYDPDSTALFVLDDQPAEALRTILVHELVHALQDQSFPLDSLTAPVLGSDRRTAAQAAIEGHATLVMMEHMASRMQEQDLDLTEIPRLSEVLRPALSAMNAQYPALAAAPRIVQESLLFPYLEGASFVQALWRARDGRPPPFGVHLPHSTEQVMERTWPSGGGGDPPTEVHLRVAPEDGVVVHEDVLGEFETRVLLATHLDDASRDLATGWDGDRYVLIEAPDGGESLVWVMVWDDAEARDAFVVALAPVLGRGSRAGRLEGAVVEGRPVSVLRVGAPPAVDVRLVEDVERRLPGGSEGDDGVSAVPAPAAGTGSGPGR